MTPKEKFNDIDFSKLPEKAKIQADKIKAVLFDKKYQSAQYAAAMQKAEEQMDTLYKKILADYPDSIKSKVAKKPEPKTPQAMAAQAAQATIKQPTVKKPKATAGANNRGNVTKLAKEIRKEGETWHAAMKRAAEMINKEKGKAVKKANAQYEKLKAFLAANPAIEKTMVTYGKKPNQGTRPLDIKRDAARIAKPKGKRVSSEGKTYYEYRANRTDSSRKRYPYLERGGELFGAGHFAKGGYTAKGEDYEYYNRFGLADNDFEQIVEVWHMHEKTPTKEVEKQYNKVMNAMEDKYGEAVIDAVVDDIFHRHGSMSIMNYGKGGKTKKGDNLPNTADEYFAAMNNFSMRLGEAEANFANDNGASYQAIMAERDELFEKTKAKWYAELNEAEGNFAKDNGKSYEAALQKLEDARMRFAKGGKVIKGRLSDTHKYIPNRMIQEIEVERKGKTTFIDGADILDGVYVKKGVKYAKGGGVNDIKLFDVYEDPNGVLWTVTKFWNDGTIGIEDTETTEKKSVTKEEFLGNYTITKYAKGGGVNSPMSIAKMMWDKKDREGRKEMLLAANYSDGVADDLSRESWVSLEKAVHSNLAKIFQSGRRKSVGQYAHGGNMPHVHSKKHKNG